MPLSAPSSPLRILVVEDEPLYAEQLEMILSQLQYQVVGPFQNAASALAALATGPAPDIALLDINLHGQGPDGIGLGRMLLEEYALPLIFLTSRADSGSFARARELGPAAYLVKPIDAAALQRAIELAVSNFAAAKQPADEPAPGTAPAAPEPTEFATPGAAVLLPNALFLKENGLLVKVVLHDVVWVEASEGGCRLVLTQGRTVSVRQVLRELAPKFPPELFVQTHRSYMVNAEYIDRIDPVRGIIQISGQLLPLSRNYRDALLQRLRQV